MAPRASRGNRPLLEVIVINRKATQLVPSFLDFYILTCAYFYCFFTNRLYDITKPLCPLDIISVGSVPPDQSLCSPGKTTFAEAFGEIVISFDFAGAMKAETFIKIRSSSDDVVYPMFLLRENGDVLYMLLTLSANRLVKLLFHSSQKPTRKLAASAFRYYDWMKIPTASLRVGFCDEWKRAFKPVFH